MPKNNIVHPADYIMYPAPIAWLRIKSRKAKKYIRLFLAWLKEALA